MPELRSGGYPSTYSGVVVCGIFSLRTVANAISITETGAETTAFRVVSEAGANWQEQEVPEFMVPDTGQKGTTSLDES